MAHATKLSLATGDPVALPDSVFECLEEGWSGHNKGEAVIARHQAADHLAEVIRVPAGSGESQASGIQQKTTYLRWTYGQFRAATIDLVAGLAERGIKPGSMIITLIPNGVEWLLLLAASIVGKFAISSLDAGMLTDARLPQFHAHLQQIAAAAIIVDSEASAKRVEGVLHSAGQEPIIKFVLQQHPPNSSFQGWAKFAELFSPTSEDEGIALARNAKHDLSDRIANIIFTSGTSSGRPKGCVRTVKNIVAVLSSQTWSRPGSVGGRRLLQNVNFRIMAPTCAMCAWRDGATIVLPGNAPGPEAILDALELERIAVALLLPAQLHGLVASPTFNARDLSALELVLVGGDMITSSTIGMCRRAFPSASYMTAHGMTEGGAVFQWMHWGPAQDIPLLNGISTLGKVSPGARLRIVADGKVAPRGELGELQIDCDTMIDRYLDETTTKDAFVNNGGRWFRTGDLAIMNNDEEFFIVGRSKDIIKRGGVVIAPAAIESSLQRWLGTEVAVLSERHPALGQQPVAIVQTLNGRTAEEVKAHVPEHFGADWQLGEVYLLARLGLTAFPTNATGKLDKLVLGERLLGMM